METCMKFMLDWRHIHETHWLDLHNKWTCLHNQHKMQQNCHICSPLRQLRFKNSRDTDHETTLHFVDRYIHDKHAGEINPTLVQISNEVWFHISKYVNSLNNRFPILIYEVSLHKNWGSYVILWECIELWGPLFFLRPKIHTHRQHFLNTVKLQVKLYLFSARQRNISQYKQFYLFVYGVFIVT